MDPKRKEKLIQNLESHLEEAERIADDCEEWNDDNATQYWLDLATTIEMRLKRLKKCQKKN